MAFFVPAINKWEAEQMQKHGWYIHFVAVDPDSPTGFNAHTHGLQERQDHPDFQIVIPMPERMLHPIMITLADRVKTGERFRAGQMLDDVITGKDGGQLLVKLVDAKECDRPVLRVIIPDKHGKVELSEIAEPFDKQYGDLA